MEIHGSSIRFDFCVIIVGQRTQELVIECMTHDLLIAAHESRVRMCVNPIKGPVFFGKGLWVEVRRPTSLIDFDMENYRESVTNADVLKHGREGIFSLSVNKIRPIWTGWDCVSHRTKEMTRYHVQYLIWMSSLFLSGDNLAHLCMARSRSPLLWWNHFRAKQLILFGRSRWKSNMPELKESQRYKDAVFT